MRNTSAVRVLTSAFAAACALSLWGGGAVASAAPSISNPGFENALSGWTQVEPVTTSATAHTGSVSAKLSSGGSIKQTVSGLAPNTAYSVTAYVRGSARIGARDFGGATVSSLKSSDTWTQATVKFATGPSNTSTQIYASWASGGDARVDDFKLTALSPETILQLTPNASRVKASTSSTNTPDRAVDGSLSTRWSGYGDGAWLRMDLGGLRTVSYAKVAIYDGAARRARFDLQVSQDGSTWTTVWSGSSSGTTTGRETYDFDDVIARYVRYRGHGFTSGTVKSAWNTVTEMQVFGSIATDSLPPPSSTADAPGDVLNLRNWKLTLPVNTSNEISQPELDSFVMSPWFTLNSAKTGVQFRAHTSGTTTSGSGYPRSELREMTSSGGKASWSTTSGSHRMFIEQAITHLPDGKKHMVAGQIHDAEDDVIVIRLEGQKLFVDINGSTGPTLDSAYTLGKRFTVEFLAEGGKIKIFYNGSTTPAYTYTVSRSGCYFKAGAYTQSNCATEKEKGYTCSTSDYGEVVIYDLQVWHE